MSNRWEKINHSWYAVVAIGGETVELTQHSVEHGVEMKEGTHEPWPTGLSLTNDCGESEWTI